MLYSNAEIWKCDFLVVASRRMIIVGWKRRGKRDRERTDNKYQNTVRQEEWVIVIYGRKATIIIAIYYIFYKELGERNPKVFNVKNW